MGASDGFIEFVKAQLSSWADVYERKIFGVVGLYCEGVLFAAITDDEVYMKVNDISREKYLQMGSLPFKPYANRPEMPSYHQVPDEVFLDSEQFIGWAEEAWRIAQQKKC